MPWKMVKDLTHPMWGKPYIPHITHKWPTVQELNRPPKPPAPMGFTHIWTDDTKTSLNSKIESKK